MRNRQNLISMRAFQTLKLLYGGSVAFSASGSRLICSALALFMGLSATAAPIPDAGSDGDGLLMEQRALYKQAMSAARAGRWQSFEEARSQLAEYPLAPYLDYEHLKRRLRSTPGSEAREFVVAHKQGPLGVRYLGHYLESAGKDRRWGDFLAAASREPRSERLRCFYGRALRGRGQQEAAWDLASQLWLSGSSVDDACDPLFRLWREDGQLTDHLIWERAELAYGARQGGLLRYIASLSSSGQRLALERLRRSYREPQRTLSLISGLEKPRAADVLVLGLERLSRYNPATALDDYQSLQPESLSQTQANRVERAIAFRGILEREVATKDWIDARLPIWKDAKLSEMRLRWAIGEGDWDAILKTLESLDEPARGTPIWVYWRGRALEAQGRQAEADEAYAAAAMQRSYYGFLSADRLGMPYSFGDDGAQSVHFPSEQLPQSAQRALGRVNELQALGEARLAHGEWTHMLQRLEAPAQVALAHVATERGWYRLGIDAANAGGASNALELRFPLAYLDEFRRQAADQSLPVSELMAIARRESAFFPDARSSVGARGLMQLMPATGRSVARTRGVGSIQLQELYGIDRNIDLGSAYYRQLLERFAGNRAVALAAYNAGPSRVQHWIGRDLPIDMWIETIPYRETRDYVKAVLAYSVVFDYRMGQDVRLLSASERQARF